MDRIKCFVRRYDPIKGKNNTVSHYVTAIKGNIYDSDTYGPSSDKYRQLTRYFETLNFGKIFSVIEQRMWKTETDGTHRYKILIGNPSYDNKIIPSRRIDDALLDDAIKKLYAFSHYL
jgi:hypothetical protein